MSSRADRPIPASRRKTVESTAKGTNLLRQTTILGARLAGNPLFLRTLLDEIRLFGQFETLSEYLLRLAAAPTLPALYSQILRRVAATPNRVVETLGASCLISALVAASRSGLLEAEIIDLTRSTALDWSGLYLELGPLVQRRGNKLPLTHQVALFRFPTTLLALPLRPRFVTSLPIDSSWQPTVEPVRLFFYARYFASRCC